MMSRRKKAKIDRQAPCIRVECFQPFLQSLVAESEGDQEIPLVLEHLGVSPATPNKKAELPSLPN